MMSSWRMPGLGEPPSPLTARAAFLRSLDAGFVHGPLGPSVKKPRGLAPDDPWLESLQGSSWVDEDLDKRDRSWLDLGSANQAPLEPSVTLKASGRGTNLCRVVALDRPGLLGDISDVFNRRGLNVVKCRAESFGNGVCRDEFELVVVQLLIEQFSVLVVSVDSSHGFEDNRCL